MRLAGITGVLKDVHFGAVRSALARLNNSQRDHADVSSSACLAPSPATPQGA